ncbi:helix-turn-helix domain-containing protein [Haliea sp. E1-2-M8]|uniref:TetR/AcrR family transcriptional regulator n=1 Tax=Haliea sp. E1-2-M8 TaxID=3064706 RepID=UPI0027198AF3|nr:TetR/AcrR family transcriptional regulator [Haliea sp. E1-2-M8]MDO8861509.1 helix-turn-helix domain-containing protein [Haliea sp. E1-2-M8]
MSESRLPQPRKRPRQQRSRALVAAIREACLKILEQEGPDRLTTERIAEVAGVNIASLYQYFPNKEAVLADVYEERMAALVAQTASEFTRIHALTDQGLEATLAAIIDLEIGLLLQLYQMYPDFYLQYQQSLDIRGRVNELTQSLANPSWEQWFPGFLRHHRAQLHQGDIDTMAFIARRSLDACLQSALAERPQALEDPGFREELLNLLLRYLLR